VPLHISGATAEWIVERPMVPHETYFSNLPLYYPMEFHHCVALEADAINLFFLPSALPQVLQGERLIRMYDFDHAKRRTKFISMPHKVDNRKIGLHYGDSFL
jgi:hypothetical protein